MPSKNKAKNDNKASLFSKLCLDKILIALLFLVLSGTTFSLMQKNNDLVEKYAPLADKYNNLIQDNLKQKDRINEINQKFALVLENVDNAIESNDISAVRESIYLFDDKVDGIPVKIFANVDDNVSLIVKDVKGLPYKDNINSIKIKNMEVTDVMTIEGNESTYGVGGQYFPDEKRIEMYSYFTEGLVHEDCHHIHNDETVWDDRDAWIYLYRGSNSSDFVSYYSKRNQKEDFAETCTFAFMNRDIANTSILNKKVNIIEKYV